MFRELRDFVDMVFAQRETARFFCRRLYRFFVRPTITPEVETDIIEPLATTFINADFEMLPVLRQLLQSEHFFDLDDSDSNDEIVGGIIKSPLELLCHAVSFFKVSLPDQVTDATKFYRNFWVNSMKNTFFSVSRYKLGEMLITDRRVLAGGTLGGVVLDSINYLETEVSNPEEAGTIIDELVPYLFPELPSSGRRNYFLNDIFLEGLDPRNWKFEWQNYVATGEDADVRIPTDQLIQVLLRTPEFQLL